MAYRKIQDRFRYRHCREIGVQDDYCIVEFNYRERGWSTIGTCHPSAIDVFKKSGVRENVELLKLASGIR